MSLIKTKIPDDIRPILARSTIAGNVLTLPGNSTAKPISAWTRC